MSRKSRMQSAREAKDKRMKMFAIGGVVLLAAVLAFEIPKVMKSSGGTASSPPAATTTAAGTGTSTTTAGPVGTAGTAPAALPAGSTKLTNSDLLPRRLKSQLYSFSRFAGKDPFVQQVSAANITSSPAGSGSSSSSGTSGSGSAGSASSSGAAYTGPPQQTAARTLAKTGAVTIQVNGKVETVRVGASFPSSNPLFTLVGVAHGVVRIGIANGSYTSGAQTVNLAPGKSLTLVDTADGVRYKLELLSAS